MSNKYELTGEIVEIMETQTFSSGFCKREFVIETDDEKYPQKIKLEVVKEKCALFDTIFDVEDKVTVAFNLRGNEYNGKYYVSLAAWKIDKVQDGSPAPQQRQQQRPPRDERGYQGGAPPPRSSGQVLPSGDDFDDSDGDQIPF